MSYTKPYQQGGRDGWAPRRIAGGIGMQKKWYEQKGMVLLLLTGAVYFFYGIFLRC